ncbi:hypothetical protein quinque_015702 [Culex quinquefasciatus]
MPLVQFNVRGKPSVNNLIFVDGYESFRWFVTRWNRQRYDRSGYYWIVHLQSFGEELDVVERILEATWELQILYAVVIVADYQEENVELFTFWPYADTHCGDVNPVRVNWRSVDLLADRLENFHGCVLKVGAFENRPFVQLDWDKLGNTYMLGFEGLLVNVLAKKLNFTVEVVVPPGNGQWGYLKKGGRSSGLMKLLMENAVHFGICSIGFTEERTSMLSPGIHHHTTYIVFAVPSGRPYSSFEKLFCLFVGHVEYICPNVGRFVVDLHDGNPDSIPGITGTKYLQVPKNFSVPRTMDAIDKSGLDYYMLELAAEFFQTTRKCLQEQNSCPTTNLSCTRSTRIGRGELNGVVLVLVDHVAYHNKYFPADEFVQVTSEYVIGFPMAAVYPKQTFLRDTINREIQMIDSSGLVQHWVEQGGDYDFESDRRGAAVTVALSIGNLIGAFQILAVLELGAVLMFLLEVGTKWSRVMKRFVDWMEEEKSEHDSEVLFVKKHNVLKE